MTTVLCYGDSNTYGYIPCSGMRYPKDVRWTGRLQVLLGSNDLKETFHASAKEIADGEGIASSDFYGALGIMIE